ncbi:hypothetical protein VTI74DRAFT_2144 [Chaetomium olivicolor]
MPPVMALQVQIEHLPMWMPRIGRTSRTSALGDSPHHGASRVHGGDVDIHVRLQIFPDCELVLCLLTKDRRNAALQVFVCQGHCAVFRKVEKFVDSRMRGGTRKKFQAQKFTKMKKTRGGRNNRTKDKETINWISDGIVSSTSRDNWEEGYWL